eukprot:TRINITY_DN5754_c0_g1_i4.p1 TRINITY_DN5754_c0_g1~~TRINITY_DN5754_c0_g1_i4.p1  ORF type:complete len:468 (-),score=102.94 TRINITY_DN5754_c0_g1_i4:422-1825(-)
MTSRVVFNNVAIRTLLQENARLSSISRLQLPFNNNLRLTVRTFASTRKPSELKDPTHHLKLPTNIQNTALNTTSQKKSFYTTSILAPQNAASTFTTLGCRLLSTSSVTWSPPGGGGGKNKSFAPKFTSRPTLTHAQLNALRFKKRMGKKRSGVIGKDEWSVVGYSAADSFDMLGLQEGLNSQLIYTELELVEELNGMCICVTSKYSNEVDDLSKEIFFFKDGNVIFWNVPELERNNVLKFLARYSIQGYDEDLIHEESELMNFTFTEGIQKPILDKGVIKLNPELETFLMDKYTLSDAIASSVKLGAWEAALDEIIDSIEHISEDLKRNANVKMSSSEVMQKTGEILALRHMINLSSDLLDTPDFYWDREGLENLFLSTCSHLAVGKRTKIVNEKLNHCLELMELVSNHLSTEHGARLEWIIIILIAIEIGFEVLHLVERKFGGFAILDPRPPRTPPTPIPVVNTTE